MTVGRGGERVINDLTEIRCEARQMHGGNGQSHTGATVVARLAYQIERDANVLGISSAELKQYRVGLLALNAAQAWSTIAAALKRGLTGF